MTTNGIERFVIGRFNKKLLRYARFVSPVTVLDAGCGEGFTLQTLKRAGIGKRLFGIDASHHAVKTGKKLFPGLSLITGDIRHMQFADASFDMVICTEVLEHVKVPQEAIAEIRRVARSYVLISVPLEPWFCIVNFLRGKYIRSWGNHPEHVNHWTFAGFIRFVEDQGFSVIQSGVSFPWSMVLARKHDQ